MRLLVTRPQPDGDRTATTLRARGHNVLVAPLMRIEFVADARFGAGPWGAIIVTSANAVRAAEQHVRRTELLRLPVFAVGQRTAEVARAAGFAEIASADGDARDLVGLIAGQHIRAPLLYLAGEDRASDVAGALAGQDTLVKTVVVYRSVRAESLPVQVEHRLATGEVDGVLHFSQRSARIYLDCVRAARILDKALVPFHYCLSWQVAEPLVAAGATKVVVAPCPEEVAILGLIG